MPRLRLETAFYVNFARITSNIVKIRIHKELFPILGVKLCYFISYFLDSKPESNVENMIKVMKLTMGK